MCVCVDACPNITNTRALGGLRYLMHKRFTEVHLLHKQPLTLSTAGTRKNEEV